MSTSNFTAKNLYYSVKKNEEQVELLFAKIEKMASDIEIIKNKITTESSISNESAPIARDLHLRHFNKDDKQRKHKLLTHFFDNAMPHLRIQNTDTEMQTKNKRDEGRLVTRFLNSCARTVVLSLKQELLKDGLDSRYWSSVPANLKAKYYTSLEEMAKTLNIPLGRCVDHWMAHALLRDCFANSGKKPVVKKRKESTPTFEGQWVDPSLEIDPEEIETPLRRKDKGKGVCKDSRSCEDKEEDQVSDYEDWPPFIKSTYVPPMIPTSPSIVAMTDEEDEERERLERLAKKAKIF